MNTNSYDPQNITEGIYNFSDGKSLIIQNQSGEYLISLVSPSTSNLEAILLKGLTMLGTEVYHNNQTSYDIHIGANLTQVILSTWIKRIDELEVVFSLLLRFYNNIFR